MYVIQTKKEFTEDFSIANSDGYTQSFAAYKKKLKSLVNDM